MPEGEINVWEVETGKRLYDLKGEAYSEVKAISFSADGKILAGAYGAILDSAEARGVFAAVNQRR